MNIQKIIQTIRQNKVFLISTHVNPDADGLCSELALARYLKSRGKKVYIVNEEPVPARFHFIKDISKIKSLAAVKALDYDVGIVLDCGELKRVGHAKGIFKEDKILINIDHHVTNGLFGTFNWVDVQASSTTEIIYLLIREMRGSIDKEMAVYLYAGIMTDTGSFRFDNTTGRTHRIIADLMKFDIPVVDLYKKFYEEVSSQDLKTLSKILNKFDIFDEGQVVSMVLGKDILSKVSPEFDLRDAIFKFLRHMKGAKIFVIFTEITSSRTRVNFRSIPGCDVAAIAEHFGGGGHKQASGCTVEEPLNRAQITVLKYIKKVL